MEERGCLTGHWIDAGEVRAFSEVAALAGQRKIAEVV